MSEKTDKILTEYVKRAVEAKGETSLRVPKLGLFEKPTEAVERYRIIFKQAALDVIIQCYEDAEDPRNYFEIFVQANNNNQ
jgi:hypothetical protein